MLIMSLTSCTSEKRAVRHLRKAERHIQKAKLLDPDVLPDVEVVTDTVYLADIQKDTVVQFKESVKDSIVFKDNTVVKYLIQHDSVFLDVDCPDQVIVTDSVFIPRPVSIEPTTKEALKKLWWLPSALLLLIVALIVLRKQ